MLEEKECLYWLMSVPGIGARYANRLLEIFGSAKNVFYAEAGRIRAVSGLKNPAKAGLLGEREEDRVRAAYAALGKAGISLFARGEAGYPAALSQIPDAPVGLFFRGACLPSPERPRTAIVGARECSYYGSSMAAHFAKELSKHGVEVVSGLARGVDYAAQKGALEGGTPTFSVLGSGVDVCYPREHQKLLEEIMAKGGVYSEYPPGTPPRSGNFPQRNRIISGMSAGVLVVEARRRSGSLITADAGLEQGKNVYAVPGRIGDVLSEGCNHLIAQGAMLVESPLDILTDLGISGIRSLDFSGKKGKTGGVFLETREKMVYGSLSLEPKHVSRLAEEAGLLLPELMGSLLLLCEKRLAKEIAKNYYVLCETVQQSRAAAHQSG